MKKLSVFLVATALLFGTSISTAAIDVEKIPATPSQEIGKLLNYPSMLIAEETFAQVSFVVNKNNEIVILSIETENDAIINYIKDRLNYKKLENVLDTGKQYVVPVRITSED